MTNTDSGIHSSARSLAPGRSRIAGWVEALVRTGDDLGPTLLRITLAIVIFPHGAQKLLGWFGGYGYGGSMGFFTQSLGIPAFFAFLAIVAEFFGSLGLLTGLFTRVAAFGIGVNMVVAVLLVHIGNGFFMNWAGTMPGEGFEYHLLVIGIVLALLVKGGGKFSLDRALSRRLSD